MDQKNRWRLRHDYVASWLGTRQDPRSGKSLNRDSNWLLLESEITKRGLCRHDSSRDSSRRWAHLRCRYRLSSNVSSIDPGMTLLFLVSMSNNSWLHYVPQWPSLLISFWSFHRVLWLWIILPARGTPRNIVRNILKKQKKIGGKWTDFGKFFNRRWWQILRILIQRNVVRNAFISIWNHQAKSNSW